MTPSNHASPPLQIGMLLYPRLTQLDLTGPYEVFSRLSNTRVRLLWKTKDAVASDRGLGILPTTLFDDCPPLDVLFAPGGAGQVGLMDDEVVLGFLARQAATARYVVSVCTGSLVLAAAGLLQGYRATCHWMSHGELALLGAIPVSERIVVDRNRITGAGVSAGIDLALTMAALLRGEAEAKAIQLGIEYSPLPPFNTGSPDSAGPELTAAVRKRFEPFMAKRHEATLRAKTRLEHQDAR